ncbi:MAG TPA: PD-(D/E)XK nuclease family protein, partial [Burkholderiales bacterium]|nr:PD-(D/E)XK nuclease family protein [Burkholderiales bacterium]
TLIHPYSVPVAEQVCAAARLIVEQHRAALPDLRAAVVLLPHLHAAPALTRELKAAAAAPALILPRVTTLRMWAGEVALDKPVTPHAARHALLYRVLSERDWLPGADLWAVAAEIAALFDELTSLAVKLPSDLAAFTRQLEKAYRARAGAAFNFEARLVHELWHAASRTSGALDPEAAYQVRLAQLAETEHAAIYCVGLSDLSPSEKRFLERVATRTPVYRFDIDAQGGDACTRTLALAWPQGEHHPDLLARSDELRWTQPKSALEGRVKIFGAQGAEQEAQAVDVTVREWLAAGLKHIAVVVNDRLTARRARALLERAQVLVEDEAGWAFSTTSAATVIGRWLDIASNDAYYRDVLDLMKSPFAFFDQPRSARQAAVWRFENYVREASIVCGLEHFITAAEAHHDREVVEILRRVQRARHNLGRGKQTIARWLTSLSLSLQELGVAQGLAADSAGVQLLELIERLRDELHGEPLTITYAQWRQWLARELETATFRDTAIESPVIFTHLAAMQLRRFDAVLILGCDAAHLPGPDPVAMFFNQSVRAELGLTTNAQRLARIEGQLSAALSCANKVMITWQRHTAGVPNLLAPQIERLSTLHRLAHGTDLVDYALNERIEASEVESAFAAIRPRATQRPAPHTSAGTVPPKFSASSYNSLMACPYQFYARYLLKLGELDEVQEEIEKKDYGELVHEVLSQFHRAHPRVLDLDPVHALAELTSASERAFEVAVARNYLARAWLTRWLALIPAYLEWQRAREQAGWTWHAGEVSRDIELTTPEGRRIIVRGRLDRIDTHAAGGVAVIDYKTQRPEVLKRKLEGFGEDVQLPVYALLWGGPVAAALFLSVERGGVKEVAIGEALDQLTEAARARLGTLYDALQNGAPLPAHGIDAVCQYCEVRGLCRRDYWS